MSNEGRNSYVMEQIREAMLSLLAEKDLPDISISELCEKAGVGRVSFYRNYKNKEDIIRDYLQELMGEWNNQQLDRPLNEVIRTIISHFEKHGEFYSLLKDRHLLFLIKDAILEIYGPKPEYEKTQAYATAFVAYTLYGWIETWFLRGMKESADEMAAMFQEQGL